MLKLATNSHQATIIASLMSACLVALLGYGLFFMIEDRWPVSAAEWAQPHSGEMIANLPAVRSAMLRLSDSEPARVIIYHPIDVQGTEWAEELRGWLIALGISANRIDLVPERDEADMIHLSVVGS